MVQQMMPMQNFPNERLVKEEITYTVKAAGFWMRFWAFLLDLLVISAITGILVKPVFKIVGLSVSDSTWYAPISILSAIVYFSYFILMTKFFAQTLGKMVFGLKVVKDSGEKLDWMTVVFRELVGRGFISNTFLKIPYLIVIFTPRHKAIHDFVADTTVVHESVFEQVKAVQLVKAVNDAQAIEKQDLAKLENGSSNHVDEMLESTGSVEQVKQNETSTTQRQDFEKKDEK